jgi:SH3-like domain-containing protein
VSGFASLRLTICAAFLGALLYAPVVAAQSAAAPAQTITLGPSGLPLPRFVSLKSGRVNSRVGPGVNYSVDWMYMKPGLPM